METVILTISYNETLNRIILKNDKYEKDNLEERPALYCANS